MRIGTEATVNMTNAPLTTSASREAMTGRICVPRTTTTPMADRTAQTATAMSSISSTGVKADSSTPSSTTGRLSAFRSVLTMTNSCSFSPLLLTLKVTVPALPVLESSLIAHSLSSAPTVPDPPAPGAGAAPEEQAPTSNVMEPRTAARIRKRIGASSWEHTSAARVSGTRGASPHGALGGAHRYRTNDAPAHHPPPAPRAPPPPPPRGGAQPPPHPHPPPPPPPPPPQFIQKPPHPGG